MVIYARISDDREGRQNGVERQEKQCRALAERNGDEVVAVFVDDDRSAYSGKPRPDYSRMLAYLRDGQADGVYGLAPTRFYRRLDDGLEFFKLINERRLYVETVKQGRYDLSTADGRRDALRAAIDAQHESEQIGERVRDAKADNLARGEYRGGPRPFGYEADGMTVRTLLCPACAAPDGFNVDRTCRACGAEAYNEPGSEAWHVEQGTDGVIAGESLRSAVRAANAAGARTTGRRFRQPDGTKGEPVSREWRAEGFRRMLMRARNAGLIEHRGEVVGKALWPALVSEDKWLACKAILEDPGRRTSPGPARVWLGSGIYRCWCGATLKGTTTGTGERARAAQRGREPGKSHVAAYRCRENAGHVVRRAVNLDQYVIDHAIERLSRADATELLLPPRPRLEPVEDLAAQANALRGKLDSIAADYAADAITRAQMLKMTADTRARLEQVEARTAQRATVSVLASLPLGTPDIAEQWDGYDLDKRRAIIDALMTVTVHRARRGRPAGFKTGAGETYFDEDTIEIGWKQAA
jgi:DNA invertase Pin-like site-specific DNA recombinase